MFNDEDLEQIEQDTIENYKNALRHLLLNLEKKDLSFDMKVRLLMEETALVYVYACLHYYFLTQHKSMKEAVTQTFKGIDNTIYEVINIITDNIDPTKIDC